MLLLRLGHAAEALAGGPDPDVPQRVPERVLSENPLSSERGRGTRQEAALRMMDEDCSGFLLFTIHEPTPDLLQVRVASHIAQPWWPPMVATIEDVLAVVRSGAE